MQLTWGILIQVFLAMGLVGLLYESFVYSLSCSRLGQEKRWTIRAIRNPTGSDFMYKGSVNPLALIPGSVDNGLIYGLGIILMLSLNNYLGKTPAAIKIIIFGLLAGLLELIAGLLTNSNYTQWDYRGNFGNIMGQTDVGHIALWGLGGALFTLVIIPALYPAMKKVDAAMSRHVVATVVVLLLAGYVTYATEMDYSKENTPMVVRLFEKMEPPFPQKLAPCPK